MSNLFCAIVVENINDTQRQQIQAAIENRAVSWWHNFPDLWIAESELMPGGWIELLGIIFPYLPAKILVLRLSDATPRWGAKMRSEDAEWLKEHLPSQPKQVEAPKAQDKQ
jgi:hypothetical protein